MNECQCCPTCHPECYITTVDIMFLKWVKQMHDSMKEAAPDHVATGWGPIIDEKIKEATSYKPTCP